MGPPHKDGAVVSDRKSTSPFWLETMTLKLFNRRHLHMVPHMAQHLKTRRANPNVRAGSGN